jgi:CheY-like chemotaxis protein
MNVKVLVVEDDALIRLGVVDEFEEQGFEVTEASNAAEALAILAGERGVEVMFTDIEMPPGMDGAQLGASVHQRWPRTKVIYTSGKAGSADLALEPESRFFSKPYDCRQIADAVRSLAKL